MSNMAGVDSTQDVFGPIGSDEGSDEGDQTDIEDGVASYGDEADGGGAASADEDTINPWHSITRRAGVVTRKRWRKVVDGYLAKDNIRESTARDKAYKKLHDYLLDAFQNAYLSELLSQQALAKDATNRTILQTAKRLRDRDDFGFDESVKYAVKKRRFLISSKMDKCFYDGNPTKEKRDESEDPSDEEEEGGEDEETDEEKQGED
jgi:hypothetical protein